MTERIDIDSLAREYGRETVAGGGRDSVLVFAFSREELAAYTRAVLDKAAYIGALSVRQGISQQKCAAAIRRMMP